jgi:hypothetical protein
VWFGWKLLAQDWLTTNTWRMKIHIVIILNVNPVVSRTM